MNSFNKLIIVSLCDGFSQKVGEKLSQNLDMMFCETKDLIAYELIDKKAMEELCSKEYLEKAEKRVIKHIATFENVVVSINFDYLIHNLSVLRPKGLIIFLKVSKSFVQENKEVINSIAFSERSSELESIANLTVKIRKNDIDYVCEKIINELGGII